MKQTGTDFNEMRTTREKRAKIQDQVEIYKPPEGKWVDLRFIGGIFSYAGSFVANKNGEGKPTKFYTPHPSYDPSTQSFDSTIFDPFYAYAQWEQANTSKEDRDKRKVQVSIYGYTNVLVRALERQKPERRPRPTSQEAETGFKDKDSETWTPIRVLKMPKGLIAKIKTLAQQNTVTHKPTGQSVVKSVADPRFGIDVRIFYDSTKEPANQYTVTLGKARTPLTEEQQKYLKWDLSELEAAEEEDQIRASFKRWIDTMKIRLDPELARQLNIGGGKAKPGKPGRPMPGDEDDEFARPAKKRGRDEDEGFDDDEAPARGKKRRPEPEYDEDGEGEDEGFDDDGSEDGDEEGFDDDGESDGYDEDGEEGDDDGYDEPKRGKNAKKPAAKSGKRRPAEEDDEFGDDGDEAPWDDGDGEEDDDGEDEGFDDDGFEDEEPKRGKKPAAKKPASKRRPEPEEDEFGDDDDGSEDDGFEDEEEAPRRPAKKPARPAPKPTRPGNGPAKRPAPERRGRR